ncbi:MAG: sulfurtransferase [Chloroflexota bacterium]|nr:sulfurtransferase [Chloroflexota bacterium]
MSKTMLLVWLVLGLGPWGGFIPVVQATTGAEATTSRVPRVAATPASAEAGYAHPEWLADAAWLKQHLDDPNLRVVALTPLDTFAAGHIPGATQIDWPELEITDTSDPSLAAWRETLAATLMRLGVTPESTVVIYDEGTLFAARLWWILRYLGHDDVRILNGGFPAWQAASGEIASGTAAVGAAESEPYSVTPDAELLAQVPEVEAALSDPSVVLIDTRTVEEYAAGHIPGAVNIQFTSNALPEAPKVWKPAAELRALYAAAGVTPETTVIPYCTTGVRSAVTAFTLALLGYDSVALFTGSWAEWSARPNTLITVGSAP